MPRVTGNENHPLKLRLSFKQREIINSALESYSPWPNDRAEFAEVKEAVAHLTCQPGGCSYCSDDLVYGKED